MCNEIPYKLVQKFFYKLFKLLFLDSERINSTMMCFFYTSTFLCKKQCIDGQIDDIDYRWYFGGLKYKFYHGWCLNSTFFGRFVNIFIVHISFNIVLYVSMYVVYKCIEYNLCIQFIIILNKDSLKIFFFLVQCIIYFRLKKITIWYKLNLH